jgi:hypothetical protein
MGDISCETGTKRDWKDLKNFQSEREGAKKQLRVWISDF